MNRLTWAKYQPKQSFGGYYQINMLKTPLKIPPYELIVETLDNSSLELLNLEILSINLVLVIYCYLDNFKVWPLSSFILGHGNIFLNVLTHERAQV